jgi:hypothetical protein
MIDINLSFQISMFGSYQDIAPSSNTIKYFIEKFSDQELIPTTFQEIDISNPLTPINRLSLRSTNEVWSVMFSANRIDIIKNNNNVGVVNMGDVQDFIDEAQNIARIIDEKFSKKHHRMALITRYLLKQMNPTEISNTFRKNVNTFGFFKTHEPIEWNNRIVSRIELNIGEFSESINVIAELNRIKGQLKINSKNEEIDRVELKFDINTYQLQTDYRFGINELTAFAFAANKIETQLKNDYKTLIC